MYTWQEIEQDWLCGSTLTLSTSDVVAAFNTAASSFGRDWVEASRMTGGGVTSGALPTLHVATLGQMLTLLADAPNAAHLLEKVKARLSDACAELTATYLVRVGTADVDIEIEPSIRVGARSRLPDFRIRQARGDWTYVEVAQPRASAGQSEVEGAIRRLVDLIKVCNESFAVEVFLTREPTSHEVAAIEADIVNPAHQVRSGEYVLPAGLGMLYWNAERPGQIILHDHGAPYTPRLSAASRTLGPSGDRQIMVRWPFTDARAQTFLESEAKQLATDAPGLIMLQASEAVGAMKAWKALLEPRFQPNLHTRVSAVCLFSTGCWLTDLGEEWRPQTKLIINPDARFPLPEWLATQLERFRSNEADLV